MSAPSGQVTDLLIAWRDGDHAALSQLTPLVYDELHRLARHYMAEERPNHTLQATALINEAYVRLIGWKNAQWKNRAHFFGVAAQLMRRVLVDCARSRQRQKRAGEAMKVSFEDGIHVPMRRPPDLIAIDDALTLLASLHERQCKVVELRFFGGLSLEETAEVLQVSVGTVRRDWTLARAWIFRELESKPTHDA